MVKTFSIFYCDLTETSQHYLREAFKTTPNEENWDSIPLATIEREIEEDETE